MKTELYTRIVIVVSVFFFGVIIFNLLQDQEIFKKTLGKIAITYMNTSEPGEIIKTASILKTNNPYTTFARHNFLNWDVQFFSYMAENGYGKDETWPGIGTYAFSPLFPFIWKITHLPAPLICILNYLMFAVSLILLSSLFLSPDDFGKTDRILLFTLALTLPSVFSFYIPYCESTFIFTFSLAIWGLFRNKRWLFYLGLVLFTLSRPSFLIVIAAIIMTDLYFLILNRRFRKFIIELGIKLLPILAGVVITFFIQFLSSGSFFKMFEVHDLFWGHFFQVPRTIKDWSTEGYAMNIFSICCVVLPTSLLFFSFLVSHLRRGQKCSITLFSAESRQDYLYILSIIFFAGNFFFVMFTQGGNLNGIHRYVLVSPFFYIFFFLFAKRLKTMKFNYMPVILISLVYLGFLLLVHGPYQHKISFLDAGYFLLVITMFYYIFFNKIYRPVKIVLLVLLVPLNTVWLTYLFNHFLNNAFIIP